MPRTSLDGCRPVGTVLMVDRYHTFIFMVRDLGEVIQTQSTMLDVSGYNGHSSDTFWFRSHLVNVGITMHAISAADLTRMIVQARSGSGEALGQLLELYRGYLRLIAGLQIGEKLQAKVSPSDLIQATFLQATRGFADFHGNSEGELMSWLRKILASQLAMELRRYATERRNVHLERQLHVDVDQSSTVLDFLAAHGKTPSQSTMRRERAVLLADALTKLPEDYRDIIVQRHLQGRSFATIANSTHRSVDSVKSAWRRAIIKLRETLGDGIL